MKLYADSGSTKTDWLLKDGDVTKVQFSTPGLNPIHLNSNDITAILQQMVKVHPMMANAADVEFYGSGCTERTIPVVRECLTQVFVKAEQIVVDSDIVGAAKVTCGGNEGVACILGTGANSCLWDGNKIVCQTPAMGYILGDEGSGAVLGKLFVNALYKGRLSAEIRKDFEEELNLDLMEVIEHVYRQPLANRWLASLSPFIMKHISDDAVEKIVEDNFLSFFRNNILPYNRSDLKVSFVGSIAYHYQSQLCKVAKDMGIEVGEIRKSPLL